jgi:CRP/FNR family transcriptional regulator
VRKHVSCLRELPIFGGLESSAFRSVCVTTARRRFPKGSYLFRQGETPDTVFLIKAGRVKLVALNDGAKEVISNIVGPGDLVNETALFTDLEYASDAVALEDTLACCYNRRQFETMVLEDPNIALQVIRYLAQKLHESDQARTEQVGMSVKDRVIRVLLKLADEHGTHRMGGMLIDAPITQSEIAAMVGASRVKVAQVLSELRSADLIERRGRHYIIKMDRCLIRNFASST